ncbi:MAG TPA: CBS domain-containing protein [Chloroflexota bacterium]|nr:CBS domain-containing protein [Chloroflexota bacterium]
MRVKDVMIPVVECLEPEMALRDASERMKALDIDPMPVCENERLVGLLSGSAVMAVAAREGLAAGSTIVRAAMTTDFVCCSGDQSLADAVRHICETLGPDARGRVPVTDDAGDLAGIVSIADLKRRAEEDVTGGVTAAGEVEAVSDLVSYKEDRVDYMSDESFPASDPQPPPTAIGPSNGGSD